MREALQQAILDGRLPQGAPLVEREIAEMLGVSKTPVREALKQLQSSGLVVATSYQGVAVRTLEAATAHELYAARLAVEPQAVRMGVERCGPGRQDAARRALGEARALLGGEHPAQLGLANRRFHREIYVLCHNEWLISFLDKLQLLNTFLATAGWRIEPTFGVEADEHQLLLDAVEAGDAERAESLVREHILEASRSLLRVLEAQGRSESGRP
ncbi:GntR family transcriptional regulator [Agromyces sp. SYSU T00194]|uniref:GntR family transcriptional regulator n=1 Tax=Agromyces chitinivorans TaxID=3158560 RepID=UPI00339185F4